MTTAQGMRLILGQVLTREGAVTYIWTLRRELPATSLCSTKESSSELEFSLVLFHVLDAYFLGASIS